MCRLSVFVMVGQALGPCCAIWFLPSLMLTSSSLHHREVQWHVVQLCALWAFVHGEPHKILERFAPCCRLCQRLFPACLSLSQRSSPNSDDIQLPARASVPRGIAHSSLVSPLRFSLSCASLAASTRPKVFVACSPVHFATLRATARHHARKAIRDRRSVGVTVSVSFPDALFLHFSWDLSTFSAEGPISNAQKGTCLPEVLIQRSKSCVGKRS